MDRSDLFPLVKAAADGVHIVAADQRIIFWNSAASHILGYEAKEVVGRFCFDVVAGGDYQGNPFCRRSCPTIQAAIRGKGALAVHMFRDVSKPRRAELLAQQTIAAVSKYSPASEKLALLESYPAP